MVCILISCKVWIPEQRAAPGRRTLPRCGALVKHRCQVQSSVQMPSSSSSGRGVRRRPTLAEEHVAHGLVHVVIGWVSAVDHETVHELHGFGSLATQFAGDDHLATLGTALHDEAQHTVTCSATNAWETMELRSDIQSNAKKKPDSRRLNAWI